MSMYPISITGEERSIEIISMSKSENHVEDYTEHSLTTKMDSSEDIENNYSIEFSIPSLTFDGLEKKNTEINEEIIEESLRHRKEGEESLLSIELYLSDLVKNYEREITMMAGIEVDTRESKNDWNRNIQINVGHSVDMDCDSLGTVRTIELSMRDHQDMSLVQVEESENYSTEGTTSNNIQKIDSSTSSNSKTYIRTKRSDGISIRVEKSGEILFEENLEIDSLVNANDKTFSSEPKLYQLMEELRKNIMKESSDDLPLTGNEIDKQQQSNRKNKIGMRGKKKNVFRIFLNQCIRLILMSIVNVNRTGDIYEQAVRKVRKHETNNRKRTSRSTIK